MLQHQRSRILSLYPFSHFKPYNHSETISPVIRLHLSDDGFCKCFTYSLTHSLTHSLTYVFTYLLEWRWCCLPGGVRLRGELAQERGEHYDRLHAVPVHLRRHRRPAVQRTILLLHRRVETHRRRVQVLQSPELKDNMQ